MKKIQNISIVGGTHGNEYTGSYLIRKLAIEHIHEKWNELHINLITGNPKAFQKGVRFIDSDLNRAFAKNDLENHHLAGYEANRAKVLDHIIGPKGSPKTDFILDVHTTTAHMGVTLILFDNNLYNLQTASYLKSKIPNCFIYYISMDTYADSSDNPFLNSLAPYGLALEIGPIANGLVRYDLFELAYKAVNTTLEFISMTNANTMPEIDTTIEVFEHRKEIEFPTDDKGNITGIIHKNIQDKDYHPIKKGDPLFVTFAGDIITYNEDNVMYPVFINEAAYYYKKIAFSLTEKKSYSIGDTV